MNIAWVTYSTCAYGFTCKIFCRLRAAPALPCCTQFSFLMNLQRSVRCLSSVTAEQLSTHLNNVVKQGA